MSRCSYTHSGIDIQRAIGLRFKPNYQTCGSNQIVKLWYASQLGVRDASQLGVWFASQLGAWFASQLGVLRVDAPTSHAKKNRRADLPREKKIEKPKCVSNDRSRRDDSNGPRIVKIGAILGYFWPCQSLRRKPTSLSATLGRA